ncbi:hypothetical protein ABZZ74_43320 [Streptomyces sp. NPDC006476]|nr:hypothetical protein [Streptomyces sp. TLI_185]
MASHRTFPQLPGDVAERWSPTAVSALVRVAARIALVDTPRSGAPV